jgi:hypothetical protein
LASRHTTQQDQSSRHFFVPTRQKKDPPKAGYFHPISGIPLVGIRRNWIPISSPLDFATQSLPPKGGKAKNNHLPNPAVGS